MISCAPHCEDYDIAELLVNSIGFGNAKLEYAVSCRGYRRAQVLPIVVEVRLFGEKSFGVSFNGFKLT